MQVIDTPAGTDTEQTEAALLAAVAGLTHAVKLQQEALDGLRASLGKGAEIADGLRKEIDQLGDELGQTRRASTSDFMVKAGITFLYVFGGAAGLVSLVALVLR